MKTKVEKYNVITAIILTTLLCFILLGLSKGKSFIETNEVSLKGSAKGGILVLIDVFGKNCRYVSIKTEKGESAELIAMRLANIINDSNPFEWVGDSEDIIAKEGTLTLWGKKGSYAFGGTEKGLGIPEPPTSLSSTYDANNHRAILNWNNPASDFDEISVFISGYPEFSWNIIFGTDEQYVHKFKQQKFKSADFRVIGFKNGVPSSPAAIHLTGNTQQELFGIPFTDGVAPNWKAWSLNARPNKEFTKSHINEKLTAGKNRRFNPIKEASQKPFKQVLNTPAGGGTVGIYRKFLGLTAGNTYRLSARLSTLGMDPDDKDWAFSLHAAPDKPDKKELSSNQMAGLTALPNDQIGPQAGRLKTLDHQELTKGQYKEYSSNITLPADSNSITVWLRLNSTSAAEVGFDWIKLEDLGNN